MTKTASHWKHDIQDALSAVEAELRKRKIAVIYGAMNTQHSAVVTVERLDWQLLDAVFDTGSIAVLELRYPPYPLDREQELRDLHVFIRLGTSDTWIHFAMETPEDESDDDAADDEEDFELSQRHSVSDEELDRLALRFAKEVGFGSLKNNGERAMFAAGQMKISGEPLLKGHDYFEIGIRAESIYRLGVAPKIAKTLESEGKSIAQIARTMGISRTRVENALETNTPIHLSKII